MKRARIYYRGRDLWTIVDEAEGVLRLPDGGTVAMADAQWLPPVTPGAATYALGLNYADHNKELGDRKSTRLNSSHTDISRMPSSA